MAWLMDFTSTALEFGLWFSIAVVNFLFFSASDFVETRTPVPDGSVGVVRLDNGMCFEVSDFLH